MSITHSNKQTLNIKTAFTKTANHPLDLHCMVLETATQSNIIHVFFSRTCYKATTKFLNPSIFELLFGVRCRHDFRTAL